MSTDPLFIKLSEISGPQNISEDPDMLKKYSKDLSLIQGKVPKYIIWATKTQQIEKILALANSMNFSIIPVSSAIDIRRHGDSLPLKDNTIILDLSKMNKILSIDAKNRVIMVEPGVTFGDLIPQLRKKGLRLLHPLLPDSKKSALTSALDREPITIPRYHWDSSDPLLCTEVVFGTGDLFRTGTAAGPGTLKEQKKTGQAQLNPMGPTQFDPFRIIQGSQGSIGVVTWVTLKLELLPTLQKLYHIQSDNLQDLLKLEHELIKYRLCDELIILNNINLACLLETKLDAIEQLENSYSKWNLIFILAGRGELAKDKIEYLDGDLQDIIKELNLDKLTKTTALNDHEIIRALSESTGKSWRLRLKGGCQEIFFLTNVEPIEEYISLAEKEIPEDLGIYIQAINQGTSHHVEFDLYHDPDDQKAIDTIKEKFSKLSIALMNKGAFFNRPYGSWAKEMYARHDDQTTIALKKVKKIFDPNNVLNPGVLCFDD